MNDIQRLTETIADMAQRIRRLEAGDHHFDQQVQYLGVRDWEIVTIKDGKQILVYGSYTIEGELVLEGSGALIIL